MIPGIEVTNDYTFKKLFGTERNLGLTRSLLNAILEQNPGNPIRVERLELLTPFNPKANSWDKLSIVDIRARDQRGRRFSLEMQQIAPPSFPERLLYYWARDFSTQLHEGEGYRLLSPTISISFLNSVLSGYDSRVVPYDEIRKARFSEAMQFHLFELPRFTLDATALASMREKWLYFMRHAATLDSKALPAALSQHPEFHWAMEELIVVAHSEQELALYEQAHRLQMDTMAYDQERQEHKEGRERLAQALHDYQQAERERQEAERNAQQLEQKRQQAERGRQQAERDRQQAERERQQAERNAQQMERNAQQMAQERDTALKSRFVDRIQMCQEVMGLPITPEDQLLQKSLAELTQLADDWLQRRRANNPTPG